VPLLLAWPVARHALRRTPPFVLPAALPWMLFLLVVQALGALFALRPEVALRALLDPVLEGLVLYLLVVNAVRTPDDLRRCLWALLLAGVLMGGVPFYQQLTGSFDNHYGGLAQVSRAAFAVGSDGTGAAVLQPRLEGPIGELNRYAQVMAMLLPVALFVFRASQSRRARLFALLAFQAAGLGVALAFSRGAALGVLLMFATLGLLGRVRLRHLGLVALLVGAVLAAVPQYTARLVSLGRVFDAVLGEGPGLRNADSATRGRVTEMLAAALVFVDHPLIGVGPSMYREHYREYGERAGLKLRDGEREAHSLYLGLAAEHGLLGLLGFGAVLAVTFRDLQRVRRRSPHGDLAEYATGLALALIGYLAIGFFLHFAYVRYFWLVMGLAAAVVAVARAEGAPAAAPARIVPRVPWRRGVRGRGAARCCEAVR
jgi:O-antigen ligase